MSLLNKGSEDILSWHQDSDKILLCILHSDPLCYFPGSLNKHLKEANYFKKLKTYSESTITLNKSYPQPKDLMRSPEEVM